MASDSEDLFDEEPRLGAPRGGDDDGLTASLDELEGLQLAERPMTAAERDRRTAPVTGGGVTTQVPYEVELKGEINATAKELDQLLEGGHLALSPKDNTIDVSRLRYSNAEDAEMRGPYQLLHSVQLDYFEHPFGSQVGMMLTLPAIKATPRDKFERAADTRSADAPYGVFAKTIMPTKQPVTLLARDVEQGVIDFCTAYPGHTSETLRKTYVVSATKDYAAIQREPIMSPIVPYYNLLAEPLGKPLVEVGGAAAGKNAHKWAPTDPELTLKAAELCDKVGQEKLNFINVTHADSMRVLLQPYQTKFDLAQRKQVAQPISFTALAGQLAFATPSAMALEANAQGGNRTAVLKYQAFKDKAERVSKPIRIGLTLRYYSFPPQHQ